jgi:putative Mg2+ transporter-C (MgtC) family protein
MDASIIEDLVRIGISVLCGSIIGFEREYRNKSAGFRTIILITLGSTLFTIVSQRIGNVSDDRIASTIVTGIGFIGAGVIFKDGFNISGLTTAAVIWVTAAIGMLIGTGNNYLAILVTILVLIILSLFNLMEDLIDRIYHRKTFHIRFVDSELQHLSKLEEQIIEHRLRSERIQLSKKAGKLDVSLKVSGNKKRMKALIEQLIVFPEIEESNIG